MVECVSALALLIVLAYFITQGRHRDAVYRRYRQFRRPRRAEPPADRPIDPNFQFDEPSDGTEENKPDGPK